jgi:hypothetical protein
MQPCGIDSLPQWLLPCLSAMAVVSGIRLLRRPAVRQVLLISSPALGVTALAVVLILSSFSQQSWSDMVDLHIAGPPPPPLSSLGRGSGGLRFAARWRPT